MEKHLLTLITILVLTASNIYSTEGELIITNYSTQKNIKVEVYPIGAIFNGEKRYKINCLHPHDPIYSKIIGGSKILYKSVGTIHYTFTLDHDGCSDNEAQAAIGYGKYRVIFVEFYTDTNFTDGVSTYCDVDFSDADYPYDGLQYFVRDLHLNFYSISNITYNFVGDPISIPELGQIVSWDQRTLNNPNSIKAQNKNGFRSDINFLDWPIDARDYEALNHVSFNEFYVNVTVEDDGVNLISNNNMIFTYSQLTIKDSVNFTLNSGTIILFEYGSKFRTFQTSGQKTITVGNNAFINMTEGSNINLNNTKFQLSQGASNWRGIKLTDTGFDTVKGCEFNSADTAISLYNSNKCRARVKKMFTDNTFNNSKLLLRNIFQCLIRDNHFSSASTQMGLLIVSNNVHPYDLNPVCDEEENPPPNVFNLNFTENHFTGGSIQMYLNCLASNLTSFFISQNTFNGANGFPRYGIVGNKVSGDIKNSGFSSDSYDYSVLVYQSEVNLYENYFTQEDGNNLSINALSSANLAPLSSYWYGGINQLHTDYTDNIVFDEGSDLNIDNGKNCLNFEEGAYHISGYLTGSCTGAQFYARNNFWTPYPPQSGIFCSGNLVTLVYSPVMENCIPQVEGIIGYDLIDHEDGIIDTIFITEDEESGQGVGTLLNEITAEEQYSQAIREKNSKNYDDAIYILKDIIDNYDSSRFVQFALGEIYMNYSLKDSGTSQASTTSLFNELKSFLETKMQQYESNTSFIQKAYSYYLMCLTKTLDYNEANLGYENIMQNHPDTTRRLLASWDRSAVVLLQQGSGGGDKDELTQDQKLEKLYSDKPVHLIAKIVFKNASANYIKRESKYDNTDMRRLENRITRFNPQSRDELDSKIGEDLEMLLELQRYYADNVQNTIPSEFVLRQNYPNPFNPVTTISFEIPKDNFIELKIYDVTGKEIMTLINEYKTAGSYSIDFNGTNLPSGAYFYKLKAGDFNSVRKMILIK